MESRVVRRHECPRRRLIILNRLASIVRWTFGRNKAEADMDDELQMTFRSDARACRSEDAYEHIGV